MTIRNITNRSSLITDQCLFPSTPTKSLSVDDCGQPRSGSGINEPLNTANRQHS